MINKALFGQGGFIDKRQYRQNCDDQPGQPLGHLFNPNCS
jgi:hypothetical protein